MRRAIVSLALLAAPAMAHAETAPVCPRTVAAPGFEGWARGGGTTLEIGRQATLMLAPAADTKFTPALARAPRPGSFGGQFALRVLRPGTYRVALGAGAWIDVVRLGKRVTSVAHRHGPNCSGIAKVVDFRLGRGAHAVQISEAKAEHIGVMVVQAEGRGR